MKAALIEQEEMRLALLRGYNILDTPPEEDFDEIAKLASEICDTPVALISLVDGDRQWFKARVGFDLAETSLEESMCSHAVLSNEFLEINDTVNDPRTADNPLVTGKEKMRFYAGALLEDESGLPLGTLCVLDDKPRELTDLQKKTLTVLARQVMRQIELRRALADAEVLRKEVDHRVKNSLQSLQALIRMQMRSEKSTEAKQALDTVQGRLSTISGLHEALYLTDSGAMVDIAPFLAKVIASVSEQMPSGVKVSRTIDSCDVDSRSASSVGMVVNEAMMNAAKYAYVDRVGGTFSVTGSADGDTYRLVMADDGPGNVNGKTDGTGLGLRIMEAAAQQLGGELEVLDNESGYAVALNWSAKKSS